LRDFSEKLGLLVRRDEMSQRALRTGFDHSRHNRVASQQLLVWMLVGILEGLKSFTNAAITIAGIELAHRIHKRQFSFGLGRPRRNWSLKLRWQRALA
jgi:hypothetical protein